MYVSGLGQSLCLSWAEVRKTQIGYADLCVCVYIGVCVCVCV